MSALQSTTDVEVRDTLGPHVAHRKCTHYQPANRQRKSYNDLAYNLLVGRLVNIRTNGIASACPTLAQGTMIIWMQTFIKATGTD